MYAALSPMRVVEIGDGVASAFCGRYLADYGAYVTTVRLATPTHGFHPVGDEDDAATRRRWDAYLHAGKELVELDLDEAGDRETLVALVREADVLVESTPRGFLPERGLGPEDFLAARPDLVYLSISAYGSAGPKSNEAGAEIVVDAAGGWMFGIGTPGREPLKPPGQQAQVLGGILGATAALGSWLTARVDGVGGLVDVSMQEAVTFFLMNPTTVEDYSGSIWTRDGGVSKANYPQGVLPCKDGIIGVNVMYFAEWDRLCTVLDMPEWRTEPLLETPIHRVRNRHIIDAVLLPWLAERTVEELYHFAQEMKLPFAPVNGPRELLGSPQLAARDYWVRMAHPDLGEITVPGLPFKLAGVEECAPHAVRNVTAPERIG